MATHDKTDGSFYVECAEGFHYLEGKWEDDGFLAGYYRPIEEVRSTSTDAPESQGKQGASDVSKDGAS